MSTDDEAEDEWLQVPSTFSLEDAANELRAKYKAAMEEQEPEDPNLEEDCSVVQRNIEALKDAKCWSSINYKIFKG